MVKLMEMQVAAQKCALKEESKLPTTAKEIGKLLWIAAIAAGRIGWTLDECWEEAEGCGDCWGLMARVVEEEGCGGEVVCEAGAGVCEVGVCEVGVCEAGGTVVC